MGQLFFRKQFFASIRDGSKTSTIRRWNRPIVTAGRDAFAPNVGWLSVLEVSQVELPELGESDAQTDGFENHAAMIKTLAELYPDQQTDGKKWYRIRFALKEPARPRGKRAKA